MIEDMYFDRDGNPISRERWAELTEQKYLGRAAWAKQGEPDMWMPDHDYSRVGWTMRDKVAVSTVWLGINHSFTLSPRPIIFETMVFGGEYDQDQWRYSTLQEAQVGHLDVVRYVFGIEFAEEWRKQYIETAT